MVEWQANIEPAGSSSPSCAVAGAILSDADLDRFIADPAMIQTHDQAVEVLDALDDEIADIQAKVDACQIEHSAKQMPPETQAWLRRASYAAAMRRNSRHRVMQRDKELRGTKSFGGNPQDPTKKEANLLKQQRLAGEVEIRRLAKQSEHIRLQNEREALAMKRREFQAQRDQQFERQFVEAARRYLPTDQFEEIRRMTKNAETQLA